MKNRAILAMAVLSSALVCGGWLLERGATPVGRDRASGVRLFEQVVDHVRADYVDTLADSTIYRHAIAGAVNELHDPHSVFLDGRRLGSLEETTNGHYAGVGIQMDLGDSGIVVIGTLPGTPAEEKGILVGDRIVSIEGRNARAMTSEEALKALRGPAGSVVHVAVERAGVVKPVAFTLERREIEVNPVRYALMLGRDVGYVDLTIFSAKAAADLTRAIDSLRSAGAKSLILDLRGDPGGLLDQGVDVADLFLDAGQKIVSTRGRLESETQSFADRAAQRWPAMPMLVITDSNSASASEIVAGALQDHDRALIVGTATYGKGSAQRLYKFKEGALKLTTALWYTPSGRSINRKRIVRGDESEDGTPAAMDSAPRPTFKTDGGRTVLGGGGIVPDIIVPQRTASAADKAFEQQVGGRMNVFRESLADFAMSLRRTGAPDTNFVVTPAMRDELYRRMEAHKLTIRRPVYDSASALVTRALGSRIARYVFGSRVEFVRQLREDPTTTRAVQLLDGVRTQRELLARAK